jgi:archaetidylinositol phosphate synthase
MQHIRLNNSFLAERERLVLQWLAARTPNYICPDHLTILGLVGGLLTAVGFAASRISPYFLALAISGLLLNWLGDSLDGTLARYRQIERPQFGYFVDHSCDLIAQTFIFLGLGLSPFFTLPSALFALSMYLLVSSYTYLKVFILRAHHLSYGGMGATELRLMIAGWAMFALWAGPAFIETPFLGFRAIDVAIGVLWGLSFIAFMWIVVDDMANFDDNLRETGAHRKPTTASLEWSLRETKREDDAARVVPRLS